MRLKVILTIVAFTLVAGFAACKGSRSGDLREVKQQRAGDYVVALLAPGGKLEDGPNEFALEFRRASDNQPVDVGPVQVSCSMPMPGQPNMIAPVTATPAGMPGRYTVLGTFEMKGAWDLTATFANGQKAQISLKVQ
jgi:hypothetical protein